LYHVPVYSLTQNVLRYIRREELLRPGDRVGVAVSGGVDSVALLRLLLELRAEIGIFVSVVHFNHQLRGADSEADQQFVAELAGGFGLEFFAESGDVAGYAAQEHCGLEAAARELRYGLFQRLMGGERVSGAPQGLKPDFFLAGPDGAAEAAPLQSSGNEGEANSQSQRRPRLTKIATGHTLDDQAETVLMRMIRGTGMRGLAGVYPRIVLQGEDHEDEDDDGCGEITRPLLGVRRQELEKYLGDIKQPWREDATNANYKFTRNRVRKLVLPLLKREFNPSVVDSFAELAEIARDEEDYWDNEVSGWLGTVVQWSEPEWARGLPEFGGSQSLVQIATSPVKPSSTKTDPELVARLEEDGPAVLNASISRPWLLTEPRAVQRRVLKAVGEHARVPLEFKHIEEILRFAAEDGPAGKELSLPLGWKIVREPEAMVFVTPDLRQQERIPDYAYSVLVPGRVFVPELGGVIEALLVPPESNFAEYNPQQLLSANLLPRQLTVRNWRAGDKFWPARTKAPKKVKELLQPRHVARPIRRLWPVLLSGEGIIWMRGFPVPARLRPKPGAEAVVIREIQRSFDHEDR
jgi:tRNA(Ile)-lysidine synthase